MSEPTDWMTKQEVAEYLGVSVRQVTRLNLPRTFVGSSPRYSRQMTDEWLKARMTVPRQEARKASRGALHIPLQPPTDLDSWAKRLAADLRSGSGGKRVKLRN
jgi:hypothetical protein